MGIGKFALFILSSGGYKKPDVTVLIVNPTPSPVSINLINREADVAIKACQVGCILDSATQVPIYNRINSTTYRHSVDSDAFERAMVYDLEVIDVNWTGGSVQPLHPDLVSTQSIPLWDPSNGNNHGCTPGG